MLTYTQSMAAVNALAGEADASIQAGCAGGGKKRKGQRGKTGGGASGCGEGEDDEERPCDGNLTHRVELELERGFWQRKDWLVRDGSAMGDAHTACGLHPLFLPIESAPKARDLRRLIIGLLPAAACQQVL